MLECRPLKTGRVAQWQSSGLLSHWLRVRISPRSLRQGFFGRSFLVASPRQGMVFESLRAHFDKDFLGGVFWLRVPGRGWHSNLSALTSTSSPAEDFSFVFLHQSSDVGERLLRKGVWCALWRTFARGLFDHESPWREGVRAAPLPHNLQENIQNGRVKPLAGLCLQIFQCLFNGPGLTV